MKKKLIHRKLIRALSGAGTNCRKKKNQVTSTLYCLELFYLVDLLRVLAKSLIVDDYLETCGLSRMDFHNIVQYASG